MRLFPRLSALLFCFAGPALAGLPPPVAQALRQAGIPEDHVAVVVQGLDGEGNGLRHGAERSFNPASVMKALTTLAALDTLGPAHTWKTRVWAAGEVTAGVLDGDLVIQGGGDPALTLERFWLLLREVRERGIREIRGDVVLDQSAYAIEPVDPGQFDEAPLRPYNAPPAALLVNYNALGLRVTQADGQVRAWLDPAPADQGFAGGLELAQGPCNGWHRALNARHDGATLRLEGRLPESCGDQQVWLNLLPPNETVAAAFATIWRELGGMHKGHFRAGPVPGGARLWLETESPQLGLIVRDVNTYSNNVMAKMLFLNVGAASQGAPATWDKADRAVRAWLAGKGLAFPELVLENGSGLSRIERISAGSLARLLAWAAASPHYYAFAASLPVLGTNGTTRSRLKDSAHAGRAWLKTGSLNGGRSLAGYVLNAQGRRKVLVMLINHPNAGAAGPAQDALIEWAMAAQAPDGGAH